MRPHPISRGGDRRHTVFRRVFPAHGRTIGRNLFQKVHTQDVDAEQSRQQCSMQRFPRRPYEKTPTVVGTVNGSNRWTIDFAAHDIPANLKVTLTLRLRLAERVVTAHCQV